MTRSQNKKKCIGAVKREGLVRNIGLLYKPCRGNLASVLRAVRDS